MYYIDTHTHIYDEAFDADRAEVVACAVAAGCQGLLLPCIDGDSLAPMHRLCAAYPDLCHPMIGLHPTEIPDDPQPTLRAMAEALEAADHPYIAIGEVGMDLYWDASRRDEQRSVFLTQAQWACRHRLPMSIHSRSAHRDIVSLLTPLRHDLAGGVFHCFSGTADEAAELLCFDGFALGIGGVITYAFGKHFPSNATAAMPPQAIARALRPDTLPSVLREVVPLERIVVETDAPYLPPAPHRGERNTPAFVPHILAALAAIYETSADTVARITTDTARRIFRLPQR